MTISDVIATIVAAVLVAAFSFLALRLVIRGKFEASGWSIDWRANPFAMAFWLCALLVSPIVIVWGFASHGLPGSRYFIYVEMTADQRPQFRYEGDGVQRALMITKDDAGEFQVSFSAMTLPAGIAWELDGASDRVEYRVFDFIGKVSSLKGMCCLRGKLRSRERGELIVIGKHEKVSLHAGENHIDINWRILEQ